jgi:holo-[acyl-carrier protein] synthase
VSTAPDLPVAGIGIDAVDIDRFRRVLERRPGLRERVFTEAERDEAASRSDPAPHLAVRFAAKEAVMKALGTGIGGFPLHDVEVVREPREGRLPGPPSVRLLDRAAELAEAQGVLRWHVSLTHTEALALAVVLAESAHPGAR